MRFAILCAKASPRWMRGFFRKRIVRQFEKEQKTALMLAVIGLANVPYAADISLAGGYLVA